MQSLIDLTEATHFSWHGSCGGEEIPEGGWRGGEEIPEGGWR